MNRNLRTSVVFLVVVVAVGSHLHATTCVANKKFKVKALCGEVTDPYGAPIPKVDVELLDNQSEVLQQVASGTDGHFSVPRVTKGEYILRVKSPYFVTAWQPVVVRKSNANDHCGKPIRVRLDVAGRCSSVFKPR